MKHLLIILALLLFIQSSLLAQNTTAEYNSNKKIIYTENAPKPIGPYSQAVEVGNILFVSGQIAINPKTNTLVNDSIENETRQIMENIKAIIEKAGYTMQDIVKTTIYLCDLNNFQKVNAIYGEYFKDNPPARETIQVVKLPRNANIEISAIAIKKN